MPQISDGGKSLSQIKKYLSELGAEILALEKIRPHVDYERAIMAIRISPEIFGVQFHPEAHPEGMRYHYQKENVKQKIIDEHGEKKYEYLLEQLEDPEKVELTQKIVLPTFITSAIQDFTKLQLLKKKPLEGLFYSPVPVSADYAAENESIQNQI